MTRRYVAVGALNRKLAIVLLIGCVVTLYGGLIAAYGEHGYDVRLAYLPASHDVLGGTSPYPTGGAELAEQRAYVYPPVLAFLLAPLTTVSPDIAATAALVFLMLLVPGILLVLGVRDWRCCAVALLWAPTFNALDNANVSLLLAFLLACAWRLRDRLAPFAAALGLALSIKLFLAPLLVWPAAVRRLRSAIASAAAAVALVFGTWAVLRFDGLSTYHALLDRLNDLERFESYSVLACAAALGLPIGLAQVVSFAIAVVLTLAAMRFGRQRDELRALAAALGAALTLTPVLWQHYLVLLLVPLALSWPRLSVIWFLPLTLWLCPMAGDNGMLVQTLAVPLVAGVLLGVVLTGEAGVRTLGFGRLANRYPFAAQPADGT
jgi:alpha-1,2-mannosyltransferase